ncbi:hypothetical protein N9H39_08600 [Gammaproteobacteria bacterium]|nr:hypothetical protein [Gammaproteobacteria bacterium]
MANLTQKNREAIDHYLSMDPEVSGNGTASWMAVYNTKNPKTAQAAWSRMLSNVIAKQYLEERQTDIEDIRVEAISYDRIRYMRDLKSLLDYAMEETEGGGIRSLSEARRIAYDLYAAHTGNLFPGQEAPMKVSININTGYHAEKIKEVKEVEKPPRVFTQKPRQRIIIGKRS